MHTKDRFDRADPYYSVHWEEYHWSEKYKQYMHWDVPVQAEDTDPDDTDPAEPDKAVVPLVPPVVITDDDPDVNVITGDDTVVPPQPGPVVVPEAQHTDQFDHNVQRLQGPGPDPARA